jgi:hypothetical protein
MKCPFAAIWRRRSWRPGCLKMGLHPQAPPVRRLRQALYHLRAAGRELSGHRQKRRSAHRLPARKILESMNLALASGRSAPSRSTQPSSASRKRSSTWGRAKWPPAAWESWSCVSSKSSTRLPTSALPASTAALKTWTTSRTWSTRSGAKAQGPLRGIHCQHCCTVNPLPVRPLAPVLASVRLPHASVAKAS